MIFPSRRQLHDSRPQVYRHGRAQGSNCDRRAQRVKALYRGWSIPCAGTQVYAPRYREEWLAGGEPCYVTYWITEVLAEGRKEIKTSVASSAKLPWQNSDTSCINL